MNKKILVSLSALFLIGTSVLSASAEEKLLLSGNKLISGDISVYQNKGIELKIINNGADYAWTEDSDAEMVSTDTNNNGQELISGLVTNHSGTYVANSKWESKTPSTAIFDLKDIYTVNQVDVWSSSTSSQQLGEISVSVSTDGINYTDIGVYQADIPDASEVEKNDTNPYGQAMGYTACKFRDTNARYVKVTGKKGTVTASGGVCRQYILGEVVILGKQKTATLPEVNNIAFTDGDGNGLYNLKNADTVNVKAIVTDTDAFLVTAVYSSEGVLKKLRTKSGMYEEFGKAYEITDSISDMDFEKGDVLKAFAVKDFEKITPLGDICTAVYYDENKTGLLTRSADFKNNVVYNAFAGFDWVTTGDYKTSEEFLAKGDLLFDGDYETLVSVSAEDDAFANIKIHFSSTMAVEKIAVYANAANDSYMSELDVYASMDGVNYEYVESKQNTMPKIGMVLPVEISLSGIVYATDIKLVAKKSADTSKLEIAEIEVRGKPPVFDSEKAVNYTYEQQVPFKTADDIVTADAENKILSDGKKDASVSSTGDYVSVIYTVEDFVQVEDITAFGNHSGLEVLTSPDGVSYFTAGFFAEKDGITKASGRAESNAKFVKLVFKKGELEKISLNEIELNTRKLYDSNAQKNTQPEKIPVRVTLKPNNIMYIDWTDYNAEKNNVNTYKVFIEESNFVSTAGKTLKQVYINGDTVKQSTVNEKFCTYAGLEPDKDYYVAVAPVEGTVTNVTPVKIHTYSALGGEKLSGMFCVNEYPYGGGAHVAHEDEAANLRTKLKLISEMEVLSKTRYWQNSNFENYMSRGFSFHQYVKGTTENEKANSFGIFTFATTNEPDINASYKDNPQGLIDKVKENHENLKAINEKNLLCDVVICGTDKLDYLESLYKLDENFGSYYDVCDVHAYCKGFEGKNNYDDNLNATSENYGVPEHIFAKVDKIYALLNKYGDGAKDLIFSEIGWSTHTLPYSKEVVMAAVTKEQQANFVARCYLVSALCDVKNVFLYAFQDESYETTDKEYQFGIVDWYGNPKPAYYTYYTLGKILKEAKVVGRIENLSHPDYGAVFYDEEKDMYVTALWNISGNGSSVTVSSKDSRMLMLDAYGNMEYVVSGKIDIGSAPVYIYSSDILLVQ